MLHPKQDKLIASAADRLARHMHAFDPSTNAAAEMTRLKADKLFFELYEEALRRVLTAFTVEVAAEMITAQLDGMDVDGAPDGSNG